jgi:hypothetical protein
MKEILVPAVEMEDILHHLKSKSGKINQFSEDRPGTHL